MKQLRRLFLILAVVLGVGFQFAGPAAVAGAMVSPVGQTMPADCDDCPRQTDELGCDAWGCVVQSAVIPSDIRSPVEPCGVHHALADMRAIGLTPLPDPHPPRSTAHA